ncbi:Na+/H+ antiporter NhaA [Stenotrophomonas sp. UBA7606]|uniref:Na+/H+ antiporter NhaA n=1 Tax=Stenotrophomonas sp. UBA7606 TaxID=1947559 RepID=UPI0031B6155B
MMRRRQARTLDRHPPEIGPSLPHELQDKNMPDASLGESSASIRRRRVARYLHTESGAAVLLVIVTVVALAWANSPLSDAYFELWHLDVGFDFGPLGLHMDLHHWVNDGLMVVFFFLIGLEVRQEFAHGSLRDRSRARLALIAGVAGVVLPALVYVLIVGLAGSEGLHGWGAVVGTDTAFMLGTLAIVGPRLSGQLRVFLLTLTVVDDFLAVSIIGIVYSEEIRVVPLLIALASLVGLWLLGRNRQWRATPYVLIVIVLWLATVYSGIHASLAGMAAGLLIPAYATQRHKVVAARQLFRDFWQSPSAASARAVDCGLSQGISVNERLHEFLRLPTALLIVPVFALANAGVDLRGGLLAEAFGSPVTWGVIAGLVLGKLLGIGLITLAAVRLGAWGACRRVSEWGACSVVRHCPESGSPCRCSSSGSRSARPPTWAAGRRSACSCR